MRKLNAATVSEDAYTGLARYAYASEAALWRALHRDGAYLAPADRRIALLANFKLQTQKHDYVQALRMWDLLQKAGIDADLADKLKPIVEQIGQLRTAAGAYQISGTLAEGGTWSVHLCRRRFLAEAVSGHLSDVKLRCSRGFVAFAFDPELQYEVPDKYGDCTLSLEGTPGSQIRFTQL